MKDSLVRFFRTPRYPDRDDQRVAATLWVSAWLIWGATLLTLLAWALGERGFLLANPIVTNLAAAATLVLVARQRLRAGGWVLVTTTHAVMLVSVFFAGSVAGTSLAGLVICILLGGLALGPRAALGFTVVVGASLVCIDQVFHHTAWRESEYVVANEPGHAISIGFFILLALLIQAGARRVQDAVRDAVRAERDLEERNRELAASEKRYRDLIENSPLGVTVVDRDLVIQVANAELTRAIGAPSGESVVGQALSALPCWGEQVVREGIKRTLERGDRSSFEASWTSKWGAAVHARLYNEPVRDETGGIVGVQTLMEDVSEQRALEERLLQSRKLEAVGRLAGGIAHEFNNRLTVMLACAEELRASIQGDDKLEALIDDVQDAADRSARLTERLLAFSQRQVFQPREVDAGEILRDAAAAFGAEAGAGVELAIEISTGAGKVKADPAQLAIALSCILTNAEEALPRGGRISVAARRVVIEREQADRLGLLRGPHVALSVCDTGAGIPPAARGRVFEPFFTTRGLPHEGLGLSTAHGIVAQSGGALEVDASPEGGARVTVTLPEIAPAPATRRPATILLVEDEDLVLAVARRALARAGDRNLEARTGPDALAILEQQPGEICVVVSDVSLPGLGGLALGRQVRERWPDLPILFVSGAGHDIPEELGAGFLAKPFSTTELRRRVDALLGRS